jgi:hypothetical protein
MPRLPVSLDTKGRVRTSKEQRRLILAEFERSGLSAIRFARRAGLKYSTFAAWVHRYRRTKRPKCTPAVQLLEAVVTPPPSSPGTALPGLKIHLPGGAWIEIEKADQVPLAVTLVRALEKPC